MSDIGEVPFYGCAAEHRALSGEILARTEAVLATGKVLQGPEVAHFEARVAATCGRAHAVAVGSGTDALYFALRAAGIAPGDDVLVTTLSFLASATAIARTGARPVFVDVDARCNLDLARAAAQIGPRTRAMVFVHLFGGMTDPAALEAFARDHGIILIEDLAQAFGARHGDRPAGSAGLAGAVSFDPTKVIGAPGSGGAVVTDDPEVAARVRRLRLHGKDGDRFVELGYNSQMPSWTASILDLKLDHHVAWTARRRQIADEYRAGLAGLPIDFPESDASAHHVWHKFVLRTARRDALRAHLSAAGIPTMIHYPRPLHREPIFASMQPDVDFPNALDHCARALSLPIHAHLARGQTAHIIDTVRRLFDR